MRGVQVVAVVGVGNRLVDIATFFSQNHVTIPHGECPTVGIGGHAQTGGYGHLLRSFGFFSLRYICTWQSMWCSLNISVRSLLVRFAPLGMS